MKFSEDKRRSYKKPLLILVLLFLAYVVFGTFHVPVQHVEKVIPHAQTNQ